MKRFLPHLFWLSGIGVIIITAFLGLGGMPASEQRSPEEQALFTKGLVLNDTGAILIVIGVVWIVVRRVVRCFSHKNVSDDHVT